MPEADPLAGAKPVEADPLAGAKPVDAPGSVFDNPTAGQRFQRLKQVGRALAPTGAAMSGALAGGEEGGALGSAFGPAGTAVGGIVGAGVGGAAGAYMQRQTEAAATGQPFQPPSPRDVAKGAILNSVFTGLGEAGAGLARGAKTESEVQAELAKLPQSQRTVGNIKRIRQAIQDRAEGNAAGFEQIRAQDLRNRDFWKAHGLNDQQIASVMQSPSLQQELARSIQQAETTKGAFQTVINTGRDSFTKRYNTVLGDVGTFDSVQANQTAIPVLRERIHDELAQLSERMGPAQPDARQYGGITPQVVEGLQHGIPDNASVQDLRNVATQLRKLRSAPSMSNPAKAALNQIDEQLQTTIEDSLHDAGATKEQIAGIKAIDQDYGRFQDTIDTLDPRSEKFGTQVAKALFDPMAKDTGSAMNFIKLAQEADKVKPGTMEQLRGAFVDKMFNEARVPAEPMQEMKNLKKLQDMWGGDKESRAVMGAMFGKDSPLADPATFSRVVDGASKPEELSLKLQGSGAGHNILKSPYFQGVITYGAWAGILGASTRGGIFSAITGSQGPEKQALAVTAMLAGPPMINYIARSGSGPAQRAMVGFMTNPNTETAVKYAGEITGALTGSLSTQGDSK